MRTGTIRSGFTLVEILIVIVILGILAAVAIPQFSSASQTAVKKSLARQWQEVENQIELYRTRNGGLLPTQDALAPMGAGDWGVLVSKNYLREEPINMYTQSTSLVPGVAASAMAAGQASGLGWYFDNTTDVNRLEIYPAGYDRVTDLLSNE